MHGSVAFSKQKYVLQDGSSSDYLRLATGISSEHYSPCLQEVIEKWSDKLSYADVSTLLEELSGEQIVSPSGVKSYLLNKAAAISSGWVEAQEAMSPIAVVETIDVLDADSREVLLMIDDVGVKAQKPHKLVARCDSDAKRLDTTVILVQDPEQRYHYATSGIDKQGKTVYCVEQAITDKVTKLHDTTQPLPIVAITDGARSIRNTLHAVFGLSVCIILDWYHLSHKVESLMSMIAVNKELKEQYVKELKELLWNGEVQKAIDYIDKMRVKNPIKQKELRDYLEKHRAEIIPYQLRQSNGKTIGSGRGEKANDLIVAHRQKKKGMAWSKAGSSALAIIKTNRLNKKLSTA